LSQKARRKFSNIFSISFNEPKEHFMKICSGSGHCVTTIWPDLFKMTTCKRSILILAWISLRKLAKIFREKQQTSIFDSRIAYH
jgi:hypothetical protein